MQEIGSTLATEKIIESLGGSTFCCEEDEELTILHAQSFFYQILGYEAGEIKRFASEEIWEGSGVSFKTLRSELAQNGFFRSEIRLKHKDGRPVWVNCLMRRALGEDGSKLVCGVLFDLTGCTLKSAGGKGSTEARLIASEKRYRMLMEESADPIFDYDLLNREVYCSPSFTRKLNFRVQGGEYRKQIRESDFVFEEDRPRAVQDAEEALRGKGKKHSEYRLKTTSGRYCWYRVRNSILFLPDGRPARVSLYFTDIDKQKKETMMLKERAERDLLTGLYNHVTTSILIDEAISQSRPGVTHALLLLDIDNFKNINDRLGHLVGDETVEELGVRLKEQFREKDIVGRTGGDEFVVFLQNISSEKILYQKARMLNELFRSARGDRKDSSIITCSVGISIYPRDGGDFHELFQKADLAMYTAKRNGKDHFCIYDQTMENNGTASGFEAQ